MKFVTKQNKLGGGQLQVTSEHKLSPIAPLATAALQYLISVFAGGGAGSDARQDSGPGYYSPGGPGRPESAASSSPPASGAGSSSVLVPQPISGAKVFPGHGLGPPPGPAHPGHAGAQGPGIRKYQCKMCPQVSTHLTPI